MFSNFLLRILISLVARLWKQHDDNGNESDIPEEQEHEDANSCSRTSIQSSSDVRTLQRNYIEKPQ